MKKLLLFLVVIVASCHYGSAQSVVVPSSPQNKIYDADNIKLKKAAMMRAMHPNTAGHFTAKKKSKQSPNNPHTLAAGTCNCDIPIDSSFSVVPFTGTDFTCSGFPGVPPDYRNDDSWTGTPITLPFNFCFYGNTYNQVYVNNNGNLTFLAYESDYTSLTFPLNYDTLMIAPFWADVDTRDPGSGLVYYKLTPTALIVKWDSVGYYDMNSDLLNTFQVILTNGADPLVPNGNNISFCYTDMEWTSGDASNGTNGLNGDPATIGVNAGDGVNYIQYGTFDHAGTDYYGAYGAPSGVEWLNGRHFDFSTCSGSSNVPPSQNGIPICDTITLCTGDSLNLPVYFFSPEINQTTTVNITTTPGLLGWTVFYNVPGSPDSISARLIANAANYGIYVITFTAVDNGTPRDTTIINLVVNINNSSNCVQTLPHPSFQSSDTVFCDESGKCINFTDFSTGNPTSWKWLFPGSDSATSTQQNPTNICYYTPGTYPVTLIVSNSSGTDTLTVSPGITDANPPSAPTTWISNDTIYCSHALSYQWYLNGSPIAGATDSFYVFQSNYGTYSVQISDGTGCNNLSGGIVITSISSFTSDGDMELYPNPVNNELVIRNLPLINGKIEIYNVLGEEVYGLQSETKNQKSEIKIDVSAFSKGVYIAIVSDENRRLISRFVKE